MNGRVIPRHLFFSKAWVVKDAQIVDAERIQLEQRYLDENPHEAALRSIFELARIDYGRIDYALRGGEIEVWEINTHPTLPWVVGPGGPAREPINAEFTRRLIRALREIEREPVRPGLRLATDPSRSPGLVTADR